MKKTFLKLFVVMLTFILTSLSVFSNLNAAPVSVKSNIDTEKVLETRFLNMLNHNFVYGEDFSDIEAIVNNSLVALLEQRDRENESYIAENIVNSYLYDMYGFTIDDFSTINTAFDYKEGYVYILPRGYWIFRHKAVSIDKNEDGTYTFITNVTIKSHDNCEENITAKTIFVENQSSVFGYNIVVSELFENI